MGNGEQPHSRQQTRPSRLSQEEIDAEMPPRQEASRSGAEAKPAWLGRFVWSVLWKVVVVVAATALMWLLARELRHLLLLLVVSLFFALAMIPGVEQIHRRGGWRRGAAVGFMYLSVVAFFALMVWVLIPAIEEFADQVRANGSGWIAHLNGLSRDVLGQDLVGE